MTDSEKKTIVVYHADCPDGFGAAWAAWKKLGDTAEYIAAHRGTDPSPILSGTNLYLVDFAYPIEKLQKLKDEGTRITFIDHHGTDAKVVDIADESLFDLNHSGAMLSWMFFHPNTPAPKLLQHIEDFDLWKFQIPNTKEIDHALSLYEKEFSTWSKIAEELETEEGMDYYVREGSILLRKIEINVQRLADSAEEIEFEGYRVLMANSPMHTSELGHELAKRKGPFGIVWSRRGNLVIVGLRGDNSIDVSKIAQKYGGGGHFSAAAFRWEEEQLLDFQKHARS